MKYFRDKYSMKMAILKNYDGTQIVEHIGVWSQGTRVLENELCWDKFKYFVQKGMILKLANFIEGIFK